MEYEKVMIKFWDYDNNFKIYCYTNDGIYYIFVKYKYNFLNSKTDYFIYNRFDTIYLLEYYENKYKNIEIYLSCIKNQKMYIYNTVNEIDKIKMFFDITEIDPPPPYEKIQNKY